MSASLPHLDETHVDVVVLGGGLTGCLITWELAARGLLVVQVERRDLGWGATGRWLRLFDGGLSPLLAGRVREARDAVRERGRLVRMAPHLVRPCPVVLLGQRHGRRVSRAWAARAPSLLSRLGAARDGWPDARPVERATIESLLPDFVMGDDGDHLLIHDALTDGRRLVVALAAAARGSGATVLTRCEPVALEADEGARGRARMSLRDQLTGAVATLSTRLVVNATGAWIDRTRRWAGTERAGHPLVRPVQALATVLDAPAAAAVRWLTRGDRGRVVAAPSADDHAVLQALLPGSSSRSRDPESPIAPAGRPNPYTSELRLRFGVGSVRARCAVPLAAPELPELAGYGRALSDRVAGIGWIDAVPGAPVLRWRLAREVTTRVARRLGARRTTVRAANVPGGDLTSLPGEEASARGQGLAPALARWLVRRFGSRWPVVVRDADAAQLAAAGWEGPPLTGAELRWSFREEGARCLADLLWRWRLPELVSSRADENEWELARRLAAVAAAEFRWSDGRLEGEWRRWQRERALAYDTAVPDGGGGDDSAGSDTDG